MKGCTNERRRLQERHQFLRQRPAAAQATSFSRPSSELFRTVQKRPGGPPVPCPAGPCARRLRTAVPAQRWHTFAKIVVGVSMIDMLPWLAPVGMGHGRGQRPMQYVERTHVQRADLGCCVVFE